MKIGVFSGFLNSVSYRSNTGKEGEKKSRENRRKIANFDNFCLTAVFFTSKVAFWRARMKNKVTAHQIKEEKLEIFASVPYRSNTGRGKKRIWERYNRHFEQIQVNFYQLFATRIRWSLENLKKKKLPQLSFVWREGGRKEEKRNSKMALQIVTPSMKKVFQPYFCQFWSANSLI